MTQLGVLAGVLAGLSVLVSGCGGSHAPSVARVGTTTSKTATAAGSGQALSPQQETAVDDAYATCLTAHGVEARAIKGGGVGIITKPGSPRPGSPTFTAAQRSCKHLLPKGGLPAPALGEQQKREAELLKFAICMRSHGEPKFPDPASNGNLLISPNSGIDPRSPQFQAAQKDCAQYFPGGFPPAANATPGG